MHGLPFQQTRATSRCCLTSWGGSLGPSGSTPAAALGGGLPDRSLQSGSGQCTTQMQSVEVLNQT